ncbi:hypothetical protein ACKI2N_032640 [Cupriavidus sp. 30B13]|uniref:hypothetical protein n=1 Tax=Cupriavidus sp. 30B13 TaxID=3384241 RepID=UPI003B8EEDE9
MLSHHELAALLIVDSTRDYRELNPLDLNSLIDRQLVTLEQLGDGQWRPRLTSYGRYVRDRIGNAPEKNA